MADFRYDIRPVPAGWTVVCNGEAGPAYADQNAAVRDTLAIASTLMAEGDRVLVRLFDMSGTGRVLEPKDSRLFGD